VTDPTSRHGQSVLYERADAAKRAFNRTDALVSVAQGYLRGVRKVTISSTGPTEVRPV